MENLPPRLTMADAIEAETLAQDGMNRARSMLKSQGYEPSVIDAELAFIAARFAASQGLDVADVAKVRMAEVEAANRALFEELKVAREVAARLEELPPGMRRQAMHILGMSDGPGKRNGKRNGRRIG